MSKFQNYMKQFDIASNVTEYEVEKAEELLQLYSPLLRRAAQGIDDMEDFCVLIADANPSQILSRWPLIMTTMEIVSALPTGWPLWGIPCSCCP